MAVTCQAILKEQLTLAGLSFESVRFGEIELKKDITAIELKKLNEALIKNDYPVRIWNILLNFDYQTNSNINENIRVQQYLSHRGIVRGVFAQNEGIKRNNV